MTRDPSARQHHRPPSRGPGDRTHELRDVLSDPRRFAIVAELVTSRGMITEERGSRVLGLARTLAANPRIDALSITDNPAGQAMLSADTLGTDLIARGQQVIIHLACKDWNRNALQSRGWKLASEGFENVLALSGDCPTGGYRGAAAPVFDIDSVGLLRMFSDMNDGLQPDRPGGAPFEPTRFFLGATVTNHKRLEREVIPQYLKLRKKVANGASFVINQIGYNARKDDELLRWMANTGIEVPAIANVFVLSARAAEAFASGRIPGVKVTDELLAIARREAGSPDRGRSFFFDLAARQIAIARGLGFRGAYIGGHLAADAYDDILDRAARFGPDEWRGLARELQYGLPDEFHLYERDPATGLSSNEVDREYARSRERARPRQAPLGYRLSRAVHGLVFEDGAPLHDAGRRLYERVERGPAAVGRTLHALEQIGKLPMFDCRDCGDCSLPDIAYLCPESQCAKNQRNGPCGGTRDGLCEVGTKECIWALAYDRLKPYGEETTMLDGPVVIKDNDLRGTSAWSNTFLGRDHHARRTPE